MGPPDLFKLTGHVYSSTTTRAIHNTYAARLRDTIHDESTILPFPPRDGGGIPADYTPPSNRKRRKLIIGSSSDSDASDAASYPPTPSHEQGGRATSPTREGSGITMQPRTPSRRPRPQDMLNNPLKRKRWLPTDPLFLTTLAQSHEDEASVSRLSTERSQSSSSPAPPLSSDELAAEDIESSPSSVSPLERHTILRDKLRRGRYVQGHEELFRLPPRENAEDRKKKAWKDVVEPGDGFCGIRSSSERDFSWRRGPRGGVRVTGAKGRGGVFRTLSLVSRIPVDGGLKKKGPVKRKSLGNQRPREKVTVCATNEFQKRATLPKSIPERREAPDMGQTIHLFADEPMLTAGPSHTPGLHEAMLLDILEEQEAGAAPEVFWAAVSQRPGTLAHSGDPDCEILA